MSRPTSELIQELAKDYRPRPWWKSPRTLFVIWFCFHLVYFFSLGAFKSDFIALRSSVLYLFLQVSGALLSAIFFMAVTRYNELRNHWPTSSAVIMLTLKSASIFIENSIMDTVVHQREWSLSSGDVSCFLHATLSTIGPVLVFPFLFRHFFFARPGWAMVFMSLHLAFLANILNELKCPDRELPHLVFGHQTVVFGIGLLIASALTFSQVPGFSKLLKRGRRIP